MVDHDSDVAVDEPADVREEEDQLEKSDDEDHLHRHAEPFGHSAGPEVQQDSLQGDQEKEHECAGSRRRNDVGERAGQDVARRAICGEERAVASASAPRSYR